MRKIITILILVFGLFALAGCFGETPEEEYPELEEFEIRSIASYDELNSIAKEQNGNPKYGFFEWLFGGRGIDTAVEDLAPETVSNQNNQESYSSKTNVQVEGVDESDVVKNDDRYLYIANFHKLTIIDTQTNAIYTYYDEFFMPSEMYLADGLVVLLGTINEHIKYPGIYPIIEPDFGFFGRYFFYGRNSFAIRVLDVTDMENITETRSLEFPNTYHVNSRVIGEDAYLILNSNRFYNYEKDEAFIPSYKDSFETEDETFLTPDQIMIMGNAHAWGYQFLVSFNIKESEAIHAEAYLGYFGEIYASEDNLYVTRNVYNVFEFISDGEKWVPVVITPQVQDDAVITSDDETTSDSDDVYRPTDNVEEIMIPWRTNSTMIYRFHLENGKMEYQQMRVVPGVILNQFNMDEQEDTFRIVTTVTNYESWKRESFAWSFDVAGNQFRYLDSIGGMGIDERIYSVRFNNDFAYVVTFRDVDPLYVVDFSDAENLVVRSELKSPGVSDYLHAYNDNLLIGVGRDISLQGRVLGVKISLFDVTNPDITEEVDIYKVLGEYSYTELQYNHKALLILKELDVFALPISVQETSSQYLQGMFVFRVDEENMKITLETIIEHKEGEEWLHDSIITRGVIIQNKLYTVSRNKVKVYDLIEKRPVHTISLIEEAN